MPICLISCKTCHFVQRMVVMLKYNNIDVAAMRNNGCCNLSRLAV